MLPESLTVSEAAAPSGTLGTIIVVFVVFVAVVLPSLGFLFYLDQQSLLDTEEEAPAPT
jgi:cytochrome d ubiquinol oxidase subunit II